MADSAEVSFAALTPDRWDDLVRLFGARGAYGGCWCMWFRQTGKEYEANRGARNRDSFHEVVQHGPAPGILAYAGGEPAGWVAVSPRELFPRLDRSRSTKRVDDVPVWSIVCFFVHREHRGEGLVAALIQAAADFAAVNGASVIEAYPLDPSVAPVSVDAGYHGLVAAFKRAGFVEAVRRTARQPVMRKVLRASPREGPPPPS